MIVNGVSNAKLEERENEAKEVKKDAEEERRQEKITMNPRFNQWILSFNDAEMRGIPTCVVENDRREQKRTGIVRTRLIVATVTTYEAACRIIDIIRKSDAQK